MRTKRMAISSEFTSDFGEPKMMYRPIVDGKDLCHLFDDENKAIIFGIAYQGLKDKNKASYATDFIMKMLEEENSK